MQDDLVLSRSLGGEEIVWWCEGRKLAEESLKTFSCFSSSNLSIFLYPSLLFHTILCSFVLLFPLGFLLEGLILFYFEKS